MLANAGELTSVADGEAEGTSTATAGLVLLDALVASMAWVVGGGGALLNELTGAVVAVLVLGAGGAIATLVPAGAVVAAVDVVATLVGATVLEAVDVVAAEVGAVEVVATLVGAVEDEVTGGGATELLVQLPDSATEPV